MKKYIRYINLGFKRHEMNDVVEFSHTGYYGYSLEKKLNDKLMVCVCSEELDTPKLYIRKAHEDSYHIIHITYEMVYDLFTDNQLSDYMTNAC